MAIVNLIPLLLTTVYSKELSHNLNYNGPFNSYNVPPRRLVADSTASENVRFCHGIGSGDPTDTDLLVCFSLIYNFTRTLYSQIRF